MNSLSWLGLLASLVACSGRSERNPAETGGAGGRDSAGGATLGGSSGNASGGAGASNIAQERSIYDAFLRQWLVARSQREPGEPIPPLGADAPCFDCVSSRGSSQCSYPAGNDCAPYTACIERHCLDTETYPASLYDCVQSCLPLEDISCHTQWLDYVSCSVPACAPVCD